MQKLRQRAIAIQWPFGFLLFIAGFIVFLVSPIQNRTSILGAVIATIGLAIGLDALGQEGVFGGR